MDNLKKILNKLSGRGYSAYRQFEGKVFRISFFEIFFDHIQPDPFAPASRIRVRIPMEIAKFPKSTYKNKSRRTGLKDFLLREFRKNSGKISKRRGEGKSGMIYSYLPSQEILERTCVQINEKWVEMRFFMGLPSRSRRILEKEFEKMLFDDLPIIIKKSLIFENLDKKSLFTHIEVCEDADFLRNSLKKLKLVAFIADGSILPRKSGIDDSPLELNKAIPFKSPSDLKVEIELPNRGKITGMGIPKGVTLIVGGGFHGKSTLLRAIERGVYNHIPGDGREFVVTLSSAIKIRSEDGRSVSGVDISPFISDLPQGTDTKFFITENASGSTSQAANIIEAIEAGTELLLIDEEMKECKD
jgi:predicted ABC-class ATPase